LFASNAAMRRADLKFPKRRGKLASMTARPDAQGSL